MDLKDSYKVIEISEINGISEINRNFELLLDSDVARKLKAIDLRRSDSKRLQDLVRDEYNLFDGTFPISFGKRSADTYDLIFYGLANDFRIMGSSLTLSISDSQNLSKEDFERQTVKYGSMKVETDDQSEALKRLFQIYVDYIGKYIID